MSKTIPTGVGNPTTLSIEEDELRDGKTLTVDPKSPRVSRITLKKNAKGKLELNLSDK
jgi:hypothetical protein